MATTTPNFGWSVPTSSDLVKNGATAIETLGDSIDASLVDLKGGTTGQVLAKATGTDMDFTWTTPSTAAGFADNGVLNSGFNVWQRGTSIAGSAGSYLYTADRWQTEASTSITVSRQATGDTTNLPFIQYCARAQRNNASTATAGVMLSQSFESVNSIPYAGKTVTLSFYARRGANYSATSNVLTVALTTGTGTDQNVFVGGYTGSSAAISQSATLTTTWQRFTYSATLATTATELGIQFTYTPTGTAGAADYYEVTGVQLEAGSSATAYHANQPTYQAELAACQRYYYKNPKTAISMGYATNATNNYSNSFHPVEMRTTPTVIQTGGATFSSNTSATTFTVDANGSGTFYSMLSFLTGASNGLSYLYRVVEWSAEL
jgi:hypothetical protein